MVTSILPFDSCISSSHRAWRALGEMDVSLRIERGFVFDDVRVAREIRADEIAIFRAPKRCVFQAKLEIADLSGLAVPYQPVVRVSAIIAFLMMRT